MGAVGDDDDVVELVFVGDGSEAVDLLLGIDGLGLGDDVGEGDAVGEEVVAAYSAFSIAGVFVGAAAEGDDEGGDLFAIEFNGVVEAGVEDGGWVAGVLCCSEDGDGVGRLGVVLASDSVDLNVDPDAPSGDDDEKQSEEVTEDATAAGASATQIGLSDHVFPESVRRPKAVPDGSTFASS